MMGWDGVMADLKQGDSSREGMRQDPVADECPTTRARKRERESVGGPQTQMFTSGSTLLDQIPGQDRSHTRKHICLLTRQDYLS